MLQTRAKSLNLNQALCKSLFSSQTWSPKDFWGLDQQCFDRTLYSLVRSKFSFWLAKALILKQYPVRKLSSWIISSLPIEIQPGVSKVLQLRRPKHRLSSYKLLAINLLSLYTALLLEAKIRRLQVSLKYLSLVPNILHQSSSLLFWKWWREIWQVSRYLQEWLSASLWITYQYHPSIGCTNLRRNSQKSQVFQDSWQHL
jgi:hypothetical protein